LILDIVYLVWNRSIFNKGGAIDQSNRLKSELTTILIDAFNPENNPQKFTIQKPIQNANKYDFEGTYREMSIGIQDWSKLLTVALQREVVKEDDKIWNISCGKYIRTGDLLFQWFEGNEFYAAFSKGKEGEKIQYVHLGTGSYEKVPLFEEQNIQLALLLILHLGLLFSIGYGIVKYLRTKNGYFIFFSLSGFVTFIGLPLFAFNLLSVDFQTLYKGATIVMILSSWLPFLGGAMLLFSVYKLWVLKRRIWFQALILINILIVPYLLYWNFPII